MLVTQTRKALLDAIEAAQACGLGLSVHVVPSPLHREAIFLLEVLASEVSSDDPEDCSHDPRLSAA